MNKNKGFTLLELMIGAAVFIVALVGALSAFTGCYTLNETARNLTFAINGAQEKLEEMFDHNFGTLVGHYSPGGHEGNTFSIHQLDWIDAGDQSAAIYILNPQTGAILNTGAGANPGLNLYEIRITVCWRQKGGRIIGEDTNLNGNLDAGEDTQVVNGILDSPAGLVTLVTRR